MSSIIAEMLANTGQMELVAAPHQWLLNPKEKRTWIKWPLENNSNRLKTPMVNDRSDGPLHRRWTFCKCQVIMENIPTIAMAEKIIPTLRKSEPINTLSSSSNFVTGCWTKPVGFPLRPITPPKRPSEDIGRFIEALKFERMTSFGQLSEFESMLSVKSQKLQARSWIDRTCSHVKDIKKRLNMLLKMLIDSNFLLNLFWMFRNSSSQRSMLEYKNIIQLFDYVIKDKVQEYSYNVVSVFFIESLDLHNNDALNITNE